MGGPVKGKVSKAVKQYVEKKIDGTAEIKQWATSYTNAGIGQGVGTKFGLTSPPNASIGGQGSGDFQRLGSKILVTEVNFRCLIQLQAGVAFETLRAMLVVDKIAAGRVLQTSEVLYDTGSGLSIVSPYKLNTGNEYRILYDKTYDCINQTSSIVAACTVHHVTIKHKFKHPLAVHYYTNAASYSASDVQANSISVVLFSGTAQITYINAYSSMSFIDA